MEEIKQPCSLTVGHLLSPSLCLTYLGQALFPYSLSSLNLCLDLNNKGQQLVAKQMN
jgi:hypothetical protein